MTGRASSATFSRPLFIAIFEERPPALAAAPAGAGLGQLPRRLFPGLGGVRRICGRSVAAPRGRTVGERRGGPVCAASGLNPERFAAWSTRCCAIARARSGTLIEWSRADLWGPPYAFDLLLYGVGPGVALAWRRVRMADWLLFARLRGGRHHAPSAMRC